MDVYNTDGFFVRLLGGGTLKSLCDITAANDGRVMVVDCDDYVHIFSKAGGQLVKFKLQGRYYSLKIAFHVLTEHVVIAGAKEESVVVVEIFTKDGEFVRSSQIHEKRSRGIAGMTVTRDGRIALLLRDIGNTCKVLVI